MKSASSFLCFRDDDLWLHDNSQTDQDLQVMEYDLALLHTNEIDKK